MKKVTAILLALALALSLAACGSHSETPAASAPTTSQASPEAPTENHAVWKRPAVRLT